MFYGGPAVGRDAQPNVGAAAADITSIPPPSKFEAIDTLILCFSCLDFIHTVTRDRCAAYRQ
ncbi:hypothetical protein PAMC26577_15855 [Caballeronia sordidicola]|uniref:Uncharacterized protein n=1 Tax=Caballeronia sordidicola TaxID=196367 RepID=A0A242MTW9_CABSO|nr:hypothetical protein PAMC26577_15855 [Caballeronia sordidicola]